MDQKTYFNILSLDGGGVRGIFSSKVLELIEKELQINIYDTFDLIVGTSTGSIIAGAVASNYSLSQLSSDYEEYAPAIFKKKCGGGYFYSTYSSNGLKNLSKKIFKNKKLKNIPKPLIINASNMSTGEVYVFKSSYQQKIREGPEYERDGDTLLSKAVLASCAAPTFFKPIMIDNKLICDGGLWANNPSLVAYTEAVNNFKKTQNQIRIFSIGTGGEKITYSNKNSFCGWGFFGKWKNRRMINFFLDQQSQFIENSLGLIMPKSILRINSSLKNCSLDDCTKVLELKKNAEEMVSKNLTKIKNFLPNKGEQL